MCEQSFPKVEKPLSKLRLIFHIGAGKTGTTSIQQNLKIQQNELRKCGVWYLGLMLENAAVSKYQWQYPTTVNDEFHALDARLAEEQLLSVFEPTFDSARDQGLHTLIWSNESFFDRYENALGALAKIQAKGVDVMIVAYVRRHDSWARSAYIQWGIKHKTYRGSLQPFSRWIENHLPQFSEQLSKLIKQFPDSVVVRNLDAIQDSVTDFFEVCRLNKFGFNAIRKNESPDGMELFLRAVFNSQFSDIVLPSKFDKLIGKDSILNLSPEEYLITMLPTGDDLEQIKGICKNDREALNAILHENNQPPIDTSPLVGKSTTFKPNVLIAKLSQMVLSQAVKIEKLEEAVKKLSKALNKLNSPKVHKADNSPHTHIFETNRPIIKQPTSFRPVILGRIGEVENKGDGMPAEKAFSITGNTGNMAFQAAIHRVLFGQRANNISYGYSLEKARALYDVMVLPCANQLGSHTDMGPQANFLEMTNMFCIAIGLGAQSSIDGATPHLKNGTERWVRAIAERSPYAQPNIAVRGEFTLEVLAQLGLGHTAIVLGCPSLFLNPLQDLGQQIAKRCEWPPQRVAIAAGSTPQIPSKLESQLADLATRTRGAYIVQHPLSMAQLAMGEIDNLEKKAIDSIRKFILPNGNTTEFLTWVREHFRVFFDIGQWTNCIAKHDFLIGTRIHGTMLAIQAGIPAICVAHDSSTMELCKTMELPYCTSSELIEKGITLDNIEAYFRFDPIKFDKRRRKLASEYLDFLRWNGVLLQSSGLHRFIDPSYKESSMISTS